MKAVIYLTGCLNLNLFASFTIDVCLHRLTVIQLIGNLRKFRQINHIYFQTTFDGFSKHFLGWLHFCQERYGFKIIIILKSKLNVRFPVED